MWEHFVYFGVCGPSHISTLLWKIRGLIDARSYLSPTLAAFQSGATEKKSHIKDRILSYTYTF